MIKLPADEGRRLELLPSYGIVGTPPESAYDHFAKLAAELLDAPICLVSLVGEKDQWLKARVGLDVESTPRAVSFCTHTILGPEPLIVLDSLKDARFADNPLVTGKPKIRFYAGAPLVAFDGTRLGALCVIDIVPRLEFADYERRCLLQIAELISERLEARRQSRPEKVVTSFSDAAALALITADEDGKITYWNPAAETLFGHAAVNVIGQSMDLIIPERFRAAHDEGLHRLRQGHEARLTGKSVEVVAQHASGREFPIELSVSIWRGVRGLEMGAHVQDLTARRQREHALQKLALHDTLTGLLNPKAFETALKERLEVSGSAAVLVLDLDGFKLVNDTLGHAIGDSLIQSVAVRLRKCVDDACTFGRLGGDEFGILLPPMADLFQARDAAGRVVHGIAETFHVDNHRLHLGASVGIALAPDHAGEVSELLARADLAMFHAKQAGGGTYRLFNSIMATQLASRRTFQEDLRSASALQQWELHYQPQVDLSDGSLVGVEALLRWRHPKLGLLLPAAFLSVLESHVVAYDVGLWVLNEACRQLAEWRSAGRFVPRVSVNLFCIQIQSGSLAAEVRTILDTHNLSPADLELELTEKTVLRQDDTGLAQLLDLKKDGVRIALDDYGTGYASLSALKRIPVSCLKIDQSFVKDVHTDRYSLAVIKGILTIAESLNVDVVAEGIETQSQEIRLTELGCRFGQGFRYGKGAALLPLPMAQNRAA